jgi:hypothetical protein
MPGHRPRNTMNTTGLAPGSQIVAYTTGVTGSITVRKAPPDRD